jgi:polyhydroxyalkanoate synthesis regulator phasin
MSDKDITKAIINILKKELGGVIDLIPNNLSQDLSNNLSPKIEEIIESNGFVKKTKYEALLKLANDLEKRVENLEKS